MFKTREKWNTCCHINKQKLSHSSAIAATTDGELMSPGETQEGVGISSRNKPVGIRLQPLPVVNLKETQDVKTGYWTQITEVHIKGMVSVSPNSCIFLYVEKALSSLIRDIWFSFN